MIINDKGMRWTIVHANIDEPAVRRYPVPGGWLYQVSTDLLVRSIGEEEKPIRDLVDWRAFDDGDEQRTWHPPVFVPSDTSPAE